MKKILFIFAALLLLTMNGFAENTCPEPGTPGWITNGDTVTVIGNGTTIGVGMAYYDGENDYAAEGLALDNAKRELSNKIFDVTYTTLKNGFRAMSAKDRVQMARRVTNQMVDGMDWKSLCHEVHIVNCNDMYVKVVLPMTEYAYQLEQLIEMNVAQFNGNTFDCWEQEKIAHELKKSLHIQDCSAS